MNTPIDRAHRFDLNVPILFDTDDGPEEGHCVNISGSGMLALFSRPVDLFIKGSLSFLIGDHYVSIHAKVVRVQEEDYGLAFQIRGDHDRDTVKVLVDYAASHNQPT